jgi:hypothetical protein
VQLKLPATEDEIARAERVLRGAAEALIKNITSFSAMLKLRGWKEDELPGELDNITAKLKDFLAAEEKIDAEHLVDGYHEIADVISKLMQVPFGISKPASLEEHHEEEKAAAAAPSHDEAQAEGDEGARDDDREESHPHRTHRGTHRRR